MRIGNEHNKQIQVLGSEGINITFCCSGNVWAGRQRTKRKLGRLPRCSALVGISEPGVPRISQRPSQTERFLRGVTQRKTRIEAKGDVGTDQMEAMPAPAARYVCQITHPFHRAGHHAKPAGPGVQSQGSEKKFVGGGTGFPGDFCSRLSPLTKIEPPGPYIYYIGSGGFDFCEPR